MASSSRLFCVLGVALFYTTCAQTPTKAPTPAPETPAAKAKIVDSYLIIPHYKSGNANSNKNWTLAGDDTVFNADLNGLFDHASHGAHGNARGVVGRLADALGYQGMEIRHYENDALRHTVMISKCEKRNLQWKLLRRAPAGLITDNVRTNVLYALRSCPSTKTHAHGGHKH